MIQTIKIDLNEDELRVLQDRLAESFMTLGDLATELLADRAAALVKS